MFTSLQFAVLPAKDNQSEWQHSYVMCVSTGLRYNAGTRSTIYYNLQGDEGQTGPRIVADVSNRVLVYNSLHSISVYLCRCSGHP